MGAYDNLEEFLKDLKKRLRKEMPRIRKEIKVYESKLSADKLTKEPFPAPQFYA